MMLAASEYSLIPVDCVWLCALCPGFSVSATDPGKSISVVINGKAIEDTDTPLHLSMSKMAVCLGDRCVMWPVLQTAELLPAETNVDDNGPPFVKISEVKVDDPAQLRQSNGRVVSSATLQTMKDAVVELTYQRHTISKHVYFGTTSHRCSLSEFITSHQWFCIR